MEWLWPHWLRPFWLLLLPLCSWLLWQLWYRQQRSGRWQSLLPAAFQAVLLSGGQARHNRLPWLALGLAWLLALLALLSPSWQHLEQASQKRTNPLVVLLDLTPAMLAADVTPDRLEQAKRKLLDLLQARRDAQTAVIVYAGSAHTLVPLSDDLATTRNLLEAIRPEIMPEPGQRADLAVDKALKLLDQGAQGHGTLLLIGSQLSQAERHAIKASLRDRRERLAILGIGSVQGAPILSDNGTFLKDSNGAILIPRLDENGLRRFATELGGRYSQARPDDADLRGLGLLDRPQTLRDSGEPTQLAAWADQGHWLLLPLLLLAACAGRRGWLFCLPLLLFSTPQASYALDWKDLWLRADQQGQRLLQAGHAKEAASRFTDPQWQGEALYRTGDYSAAAKRFAQNNSAVGHYNRGNALAKNNELEAALDAYDQALERQPEMPQALSNKALVEQLLRQQQQQQQQQDNPNPEQVQQQSDSATPPTPIQPSSGQTSAQQQEHKAPAPAEQQPSEPVPQQSSGTQTTSEDMQQQHSRAEGDGEPQDAAALVQPLDSEQRDALEQWLRQIPDEPGELLRRKFLYEQQQHQEQPQ